MWIFATPTCPRCGCTDAQRIGEQMIDTGDGASAEQTPSYGQVVYLYMCECGLAFSHAAGHEDGVDDAAAPTVPLQAPDETG
jgi:hypothetical protein